MTDLHCLVQLSSSQGGNPDREHRGRLSQWVEADASARSHFWGAAAEARQRQDAHPQTVQRQQSVAVHRKQRSPSRVHRFRRSVRNLFISS